MRVGLTLAGSMVSDDGARFAAQLGVDATSSCISPTTRTAAPTRPRISTARRSGPIDGDCPREPLWTYERSRPARAMLAAHGLACAALENFSPNFWSDILLDGPKKREQMEGLKRLVRDAGRAGIPVLRLQFLDRRRLGLACAGRSPAAAPITVVFDMDAIDPDEPIPDGMVWNMRYREGVPGAAPVARVGGGAVGSARLVPARARAGRRGGRRAARRPSRRPAGADAPRHGAAGQRAREVRPAARASSTARPTRSSSASARSPRCRTATSTRRRGISRAGKIAYVHFRNVTRQGAALSRDLRRRRRRRHGRDRAHPPRRGLRRRDGPRPRAGALLPGAVARRARLYRRLHEGARRQRRPARAIRRHGRRAAAAQPIGEHARTDETARPAEDGCGDTTQRSRQGRKR